MRGDNMPEVLQNDTFKPTVWNHVWSLILQGTHILKTMFLSTISNWIYYFTLCEQSETLDYHPWYWEFILFSSFYLFIVECTFCMTNKLFTLKNVQTRYFNKTFTSGDSKKNQLIRKILFYDHCCFLIFNFKRWLLLYFVEKRPIIWLFKPQFFLDIKRILRLARRIFNDDRMEVYY